MNTMTITEEVLNVCDRTRLTEYLTLHRLPISQAMAVHLVDDRKMRPCEAARLLGVSNIAISDACAKGRAKLKKKTD